MDRILVRVLAVGSLLVLAAAAGAQAASVSSAEPPSGRPLVPGLPRLEVLGPPASGAGDVPLFSWSPVEGAATYELVVLGPDGPIWAWIGEQTDVRLGGLDIERPPGLGGPVIAVGTCWSVVAYDATDRAVAVSDFLAVAAGDSGGHECVPGVGARQPPNG